MYICIGAVRDGAVTQAGKKPDFVIFLFGIMPCS
jgi:hypothetical protein